MLDIVTKLLVGDYQVRIKYTGDKVRGRASYNKETHSHV